MQGTMNMQEDAGEGLEKFMVGDLSTIIYVPNFLTEDEQNLLLHQINTVPMSKWKTLKNRRLQNWGGVVHEKGLLQQPLPPWLSLITQRISSWTRLFPSPINHVLINEYLAGQGIMPHQDGPAYFPVVAILSLGSPAVMNFTPHPKLLNSSDLEKSLSNQTTSTSLKSLQEGNHGEYQILLDDSREDVRREENKVYSVAMLPRSLLIFKDSAYEDYLHGIEECAVHEFEEVVNADSIFCDFSSNMDKNTDYSKKEEAFSLEKKHNLSRTGTRISLTCRLVPKVNKSLIKL